MADFKWPAIWPHHAVTMSGERPPRVSVIEAELARCGLRLRGSGTGETARIVGIADRTLRRIRAGKSVRPEQLEKFVRFFSTRPTDGRTWTIEDLVDVEKERAQRSEAVGRAVHPTKAPAHGEQTRAGSSHIERPALLTAILDALPLSRTALVGLVGAGGMGKTVLIEQILAKRSGDYEAAFVVDVRESGGGAKAVVAALLARLGCAGQVADLPGGIDRARREMVRRSLGVSPRPMLVVFDNADSPTGELCDVIRRLGDTIAVTCHLLVATHMPDFGSRTGAIMVSVPPFSLDEGVRFLEGRLYGDRRLKGSGGRGLLSDIVILEGGVPLWLDHAARELLENKQLSLAEYAAGSRAEARVLARLADKDERAGFFAACACSEHEDGFSLDVLSGTLCIDHGRAEVLARQLVARGFLVALKPERFRVAHNAIRAVGRRSTEAFAEHAAAHARYVLDQLGRGEGARLDLARLKPLGEEIEEAARASLEHRLPETFVQLCVRSEYLWRHAGEWGRAEWYLELAAQQAMDVDDRSRLLYGRALILKFLGQYRLALDLLDEAVHPGHVRQAQALDERGLLLAYFGRFAEARLCVDRALALALAHNHGPRHVAITHNRMAEVEWLSENFGRVIDAAGRALSLARGAASELGVEGRVPTIRELAGAYHFLGLGHLGLGQIEAARASLKTAVELRRGASAPYQVANSLNYLGIVESRAGNLSLADGLLNEGREISEGLGDVRRNAEFHELMAEHLARCGHPSEAEAHLEKACKLHADTGRNHYVPMMKARYGRVGSVM